jgi:hypothetical protein
LASVPDLVLVTLTRKLFAQKSWYCCTLMGILMNTRGIIPLVVLNIGVLLKVILPTILILMTTSLIFLTSSILSVFCEGNSDPKVLEE